MMDSRMEWARSRDQLVSAIRDLGFPEELGEQIAKQLRSPKAMDRMKGYLYNVKPRSAELIVDEILHVRWKSLKQDIEGVKQDIEGVKQDIEISKQDIQIPDELGNKTKQHIKDLYAEFGYERFFGRTEVMEVLSITASPASALLKKMLDMKLVYPMKGKGKGKYLFKR